MSVSRHRRIVIEKEHYVEVLHYNEIMELLSEFQLLKTMLNDGPVILS